MKCAQRRVVDMIGGEVCVHDSSRAEFISEIDTIGAGVRPRNHVDENYDNDNDEGVIAAEEHEPEDEYSAFEISDPKAEAADIEDPEFIAALEAVSCPVCLESLCDPLKLPCNHAFCRICLHFVLRTAAEMKCPLCRAPIHIKDCTNYPTDLETEELVRKLVMPNIYDERKETARSELHARISGTLTNLPIHLATTPIRPGQRIEVVFNEETSFVLTRAMENDRLFLSADSAQFPQTWVVLVIPLTSMLFERESCTFFVRFTRFRV